MGREDSVAADVDDAPRPRFLGGQKAKIISFVRCEAFLGEKQTGIKGILFIHSSLRSHRRRPDRSRPKLSQLLRTHRRGEARLRSPARRHGAVIQPD